MARRWVYDASPLIALGKIGLLDVLAKLSDGHVIPEAVADEVRAGRVMDPAKRWLLESPDVPVVPSSIHPAVVEWGLGAGESSAISFALENDGFQPVLDERAGRACARALGLQPLGTLGILSLAKKHGVIVAVRPYLDALLEAGYRLDSQLIALVIEEAGEG